MSTSMAAAVAASANFPNSSCPPGSLFLGYPSSHCYRQSIAIHSRMRPVKLRGTITEVRGFAVESSLLARVEEGEMAKPLVGDGDGIIIVDHGSRRKESNLMLNEFVAMFRKRTGYAIVEPAHMELAEPSIKDAFDLCVQQGASRIIISPFFLFPGRHWYQDIPALTAKAAEAHPGLPYIVTAPLGLHELLVDVVNDRIEYCLKHAAGQIEECAACAGSGRCQFN